jgi:hypothetical protein
MGFDIAARRWMHSVWVNVCNGSGLIVRCSSSGRSWLIYAGRMFVVYACGWRRMIWSGRWFCVEFIPLCISKHWLRGWMWMWMWMIHRVGTVWVVIGFVNSNESKTFGNSKWLLACLGYFQLTTLICSSPTRGARQWTKWRW